jgi:hypothetical protein
VVCASLLSAKFAMDQEYAGKEQQKQQDNVKLRQLENLDMQISELERSKNLRTKKGHDQAKHLFEWSKQTNADIDQLASNQKKLELVAKVSATATILLVAFELLKGGLGLFEWAHRHKAVEKIVKGGRDMFQRFHLLRTGNIIGPEQTLGPLQEEWEEWPEEASGDVVEMSQVNGTLPPLRKRLHARDWKRADLSNN